MNSITSPQGNAQGGDFSTALQTNCNKIAAQISNVAEEQEQLRGNIESNLKRMDKIADDHREIVDDQGKIKKKLIEMDVKLDAFDDLFIVKIYYATEKVFECIGSFFRSLCLYPFNHEGKKL